jgi:phosphoglycolate phosphatase-like HAD superfamily hydrolase
MGTDKSLSELLPEQKMLDLFFDLDGPILDVSEKYYRVYADLVKEYGSQPIPKEDYWDYKRRRIPDDTILGLSGITGWVEEYRQLRKSRIETLEYLACDRIWPGVLFMLQELASHTSLILVTLRNSSETLTWELHNLGLLRVFSQVLSTSGDNTGVERAQVKVQLVQNALGLKSFSGWFIGDTETDIRTGQLLGLQTAAVTYGIRTKEQLASVQPDVLLESPEHLIEWGQTSLINKMSANAV